MAEKDSGPAPIANTDGAHLVDLQKSASSANLTAALNSGRVPAPSPAPAPSASESTGQGADTAKDK